MTTKNLTKKKVNSGPTLVIDNLENLFNKHPKMEETN